MSKQKTRLSSRGLVEYRCVCERKVLFHGVLSKGSVVRMHCRGCKAIIAVRAPADGGDALVSQVVDGLVTPREVVKASPLDADYSTLTIRSGEQALRAQRELLAEIEAEIDKKRRNETTLAQHVEALRVELVELQHRLSSRRSRSVSASLKQRILHRDGYNCRYCSIAVTPGDIHLDHVIPFSRGGATSYENLVVACAPCNLRKGDKLPEEAGLTLWRRQECGA